MPFIDTTRAGDAVKVTEENIQSDFGDILESNGWTTATYFKKVAFPASFMNPQNPRIDISTVDICVAEHFIYKNADDKMFGLAIIGEWGVKWGQIPTGNNPYDDTLQLFGTWATNQFRLYRSPRTLYFYMIETLDGLDTQQGKNIVLPWTESTKDGLRRAALDVEVEESAWIVQESSPIFQVTNAHPKRMQSPVVNAGLRANFIESFTDYNSPVQYTNWWNDSEIAIKGFIDDKTIFVSIQADNVPAPEGNLVPSIPFHFGKIDPIEEGDVVYAMFAGSVPTGDTIAKVSGYDYDDPKLKIPAFMPLIKSYPQFPSNGVNSVMLSRAKLGARYQAHYLSWNAPPNAMPPARTDGGKDYPRAWGRAENPMYGYQFNPSRYSDKVHTSRIYIVHPEEGLRGSLFRSIALAPISFSATKLRVRKEACPDPVYEMYRFMLFDGVCPLSARPGTQFHAAGIGIYEQDVDSNNDPITVTP